MKKRGLSADPGEIPTPPEIGTSDGGAGKFYQGGIGQINIQGFIKAVTDGTDQSTEPPRGGLPVNDIEDGKRHRAGEYRIARLQKSGIAFPLADDTTKGPFSQNVENQVANEGVNPDKDERELGFDGKPVPYRSLARAGKYLDPVRYLAHLPIHGVVKQSSSLPPTGPIIEDPHEGLDDATVPNRLRQAVSRPTNPIPYFPPAALAVPSNERSAKEQTKISFITKLMPGFVKKQVRGT